MQEAKVTLARRSSTISPRLDCGDPFLWAPDMICVPSEPRFSGLFRLGARVLLNDLLRPGRPAAKETLRFGSTDPKKGASSTPNYTFHRFPSGICVTSVSFACRNKREVVLQVEHELYGVSV